MSCSSSWVWLHVSWAHAAKMRCCQPQQPYTASSRAQLTRAWPCSVWLAHADNARGFTAKLAAAGHTHPANSADERHPARALGTHAAPEVFEQASHPSVTRLPAVRTCVRGLNSDFSRIRMHHVHAAV